MPSGPLTASASDAIFIAIFSPRSFFLFNNVFQKIFLKTVVVRGSIGDTRFRSVQFQMVSNRLGKLILQSALSVSGNSPAFPGKRFRCFSHRQLLTYSRLVLPSEDGPLGRRSGFFFVRSQVSPRGDVILLTRSHPSPASVPPPPQAHDWGTTGAEFRSCLPRAESL